MNIVLIGAGGVGGWVASALVKTVPKGELLIIDKDIVEPKNLSRQLFEASSVGKAKAELLAASVRKQLPPGSELKITAGVYWFMGQVDDVRMESGDLPELIINVCDNHTARLRSLALADQLKIPAIFGANESVDAEGYLYRPEWKNSERDPRIYYPELFDPDKDDPTKVSCVEEAELEVAAGEVAQTPIANFMAAAYILWLINAQILDGSKPVESYRYLPYRINNTFGRLWATSEKIRT